MTAQLSAIRDRLELILSVPSSDGYVDSQTQLDDVNAAYEKTAYAYNWPQMLRRVGIIITANVDRYPLPVRFRKAHFVKVEDVEYDETEFKFLKKSRRKYAIDRDASQIIFSNVPTSASTAFTLSNAESTGAAVTIELSSVTGLSQYDEVFIDSVTGTDEFTLVSAVSTANTTITARLRAAKSSGDSLYRQKEIIDMFYFQNVILLSASTDTTILPDELDFIIPHYAAYLAYLRLEVPDLAQQHLQIWQDAVNRAFLAQGQNSSGGVAQFTIE